jgi:hypothetical protein
VPLGTAATNALDGMCSNEPVADPPYCGQMRVEEWWNDN